MLTIGVFADQPFASTGFANVCRNIANELTRYANVIYFGRYGRKEGFDKKISLLPEQYFAYVATQGGVWDEHMCKQLIERYNIDVVFSEDDWYSIGGLANACAYHKIPFHFHTPIDSIPISKDAYKIFSMCNVVYIPNRSWINIDGKKRFNWISKDVSQRGGERIKAVYLKHGVDPTLFKPMKVERDDTFTFLWIGRIEPRKAPSRMIKAFEKLSKVADVRLFMRSDWSTPLATQVLKYIYRKNLPVTTDQMTNCGHGELAKIYNVADVNVVTAKAGGFELSTIEAGACGKPTIVTDWTYMSDVVVDGVTGIRVPVEGFTHPPIGYNDRERIWGNISVEKLYEAMLYCYTNQGAMDIMGRSAMRHVYKEYNWNDVGKKLWSYIRQTV